jgi:hypothetical protein
MELNYYIFKNKFFFAHRIIFHVFPPQMIKVLMRDFLCFSQIFILFSFLKLFLGNEFSSTDRGTLTFAKRKIVEYLPSFTNTHDAVEIICYLFFYCIFVPISEYCLEDIFKIWNDFLDQFYHDQKLSIWKFRNNVFCK